MLRSLLSLEFDELRLRPLHEVALDFLLRAFCPTPCAGCQGPSGPLCAHCEVDLLSSPEELQESDFSPPHLSLGPYRGRLQRLIQHGKFEDCPSLTGRLATHLVTRLLARRELLEGIDALVPIPNAPSSPRTHPTCILATELSRRSRLRLLEDLLVRRPDSRRTHWLGESARPAHVERTLLGGAHPPRQISRVILVDDIRTTGSTLRHARRLLALRGIQVGLELTLAWTPRATSWSTRRGSSPAGDELFSSSGHQKKESPSRTSRSSTQGPGCA